MRSIQLSSESHCHFPWYLADASAVVRSCFSISALNDIIRGAQIQIIGVQYIPHVVLDNRVIDSHRREANRLALLLESENVSCIFRGGLARSSAWDWHFIEREERQGLCHLINGRGG
jgi:hypothetical protein